MTPWARNLISSFQTKAFLALIKTNISHTYYLHEGEKKSKNWEKKIEGKRLKGENCKAYSCIGFSPMI